MSLIGGNYDINFIDNLNYDASLAEKSSGSKDDHEIAASVLAAIIKTTKEIRTKSKFFSKE